VNITSATSSGNQFLSLESEGVPHGGVTSVSGELAVLMLETQEQQKQIAREELADARHDFSEALADEVQALRDQADATFHGAMFSGAMSIAGAGMGAWAAGRKCDNPWQKPVGEGLSQLSGPLGTMVGTSYGAADAKQAQGVEEAAKWQINDGRDAVSDARNLQNKALDWASSMVDRDAATTAAILANKV
jgi:hypothetical protein